MSFKRCPHCIFNSRFLRMRGVLLNNQLIPSCSPINLLINTDLPISQLIPSDLPTSPLIPSDLPISQLIPSDSTISKLITPNSGIKEPGPSKMGLKRGRSRTRNRIARREKLMLPSQFLEKVEGTIFKLDGSERRGLIKMDDGNLVITYDYQTF